MNTEGCYCCGTTRRRQVALRSHEGAFSQCLECGLAALALRHLPADYERHYSDTYYPAEYAGRNENRRTLFAYRFKLLKRHFPPTGTLLEVGAASGEFLDLLRDVGYSVRGVELSSRAAEQAARKYGLEVFQGTLSQAGFPADTFDYLLMYHVLEHVPDPGALLKEARRVLKQGGRLLIEVPNVESIDARFSADLRESILDFPHHAYGFSPRSLPMLLSREGFRVIAVEVSMPFLLARPVHWALSLVRRRTVQTPEAASEDVSGARLFATARPDPFWRRWIARMVPGMKLTIVAGKY